ncbi:MAG: hypothetical protein ABII97_00930 [Patescibacteria group bacterium]
MIGWNYQTVCSKCGKTIKISFSADVEWVRKKIDELGCQECRAKKTFESLKALGILTVDQKLGPEDPSFGISGNALGQEILRFWVRTESGPFHDPADWRGVA